MFLGYQGAPFNIAKGKETRLGNKIRLTGEFFALSPKPSFVNSKILESLQNKCTKLLIVSEQIFMAYIITLAISSDCEWYKLEQVESDW